MGLAMAAPCVSEVKLLMQVPNTPHLLTQGSKMYVTHFSWFGSMLDKDHAPTKANQKRSCAAHARTIEASTQACKQ